ncbi:MAG: OmpA family protein [Spirochaetota bacterium]
MRHSERPPHLDVNVDHGHYVELVPLVRGASRSLGVTTIAQGQRRARIELAVTGPAGSRREHVAVVELTNLPTNLGRKPHIALHARVARGGVAELRCEVEGELVRTERVPVRKWLPTPPAAWLVPMGVAVVAALVLLGLRLTVWSPRPGDVATIETGTVATTGDRDGDARADRDGDSRAERNGDATALSKDPGEGASEGSAETGETATPRNWTVYFLPDDATLIPETRRALDEIADRLGALAGEGEGVGTLRIVGHCALAGNEAGRIELSRARAGNVWRHLRQAGVDQPEELVVRGDGGEDPVTRDADSQHLNRRVEIHVAAARDDTSGDGSGDNAGE